MSYDEKGDFDHPEVHGAAPAAKTRFVSETRAE